MSRKGEELLGPPASSADVSQKGKELLGSTKEPASEVAPPETTQAAPKGSRAEASSSPSLLSRLGATTGRAADAALVPSSTAASSSSLLSRLNRSDPSTARPVETAKVASTGVASNGTPPRSLKDRLNGSASGSASAPSPTLQPTAPSGPTELSIRSRSQEAPAASLSILNRSSNGRTQAKDTGAGESAGQASPASSAFSVKGVAAKRPLSADDQDDEEPVVYKKKGRGHQRDEDSSGDIIMAAQATPQVVQPFKPQVVQPSKPQVSASLGSSLGGPAGGSPAPAQGKRSLAGRLSRPVRR